MSALDDRLDAFFAEDPVAKAIYNSRKAAEYAVKAASVYVEVHGAVYGSDHAAADYNNNSQPFNSLSFPVGGAQGTVIEYSSADALDELIGALYNAGAIDDDDNPLAKVALGIAAAYYDVAEGIGDGCSVTRRAENYDSVVDDGVHGVNA
jgi:hypothetical protein